MKTELSHESLNQLIPWYVNGTLSPEELAVVERHLENCAACQSDVEWMREVGSAMTGLASEAPAPEVSFNKVLAAVEQWERSKDHARFGWISNWWKAIWSSSAPFARFALAAQLALIAGLCLAIWFSHREVQPSFTVLSGSEPSNSGGAKLTISFTPETTISQVRQMLTGIGGTIVGGPSANGIYIIQLPTAASKDDEVQATIQQLRKNTSIQFVERLP